MNYQYKLSLIQRCVILLPVFIFAACFSHWNGDEGTISISFGSGQSGARFLDSEIISDLKHTILLTNGPGKEQIRENITGNQTVDFSLMPGRWDVFVQAYHENRLFDIEYNEYEFFQYKLLAEGSKTIGIKPGANGEVSIPMGAAKPKSLTLTGLAKYPDRTRVQVKLFDVEANYWDILYSVPDVPEITGEGLIENGKATVYLYQYGIQSEIDCLWNSAGSWNVLVGIGDGVFQGNNSVYAGGDMYISKGAVRFHAANTSRSLSDLKRALYRYEFDAIADGWGGVDISDWTLDRWCIELMGFGYNDWSKETGYKMYRDETMARPFGAAEKIKGRSVYMPFPFESMFGLYFGPKNGEIRGTITLTGISNPPPRVRLEIYASDYAWFAMGQILMKGVSGSDATLDWVLPVHKNFTPRECAVYLDVQPVGSTGSFVFPVSSSEYFGSLDEKKHLDKVDITLISMNGTVTVTYNGYAVPYVEISTMSGGFEYVTMASPGPNTAWAIQSKPLDAPENISFVLRGFNLNMDWLFDEIFEDAASFGRENISGIILDARDIPGECTPVAAQALSPNVRNKGAIDSPDTDSRWYSINVSKGARYYLWWDDSDTDWHTGKEHMNVMIRVYDWHGMLLLDRDTPNNYSFVASTSGIVHIKVIPLYRGNTGTFDMVYNTSGIKPK